MNTKEVCSKLSVTPKMLRVYENQKLICAKRGENNYRNYSIDDVLQIQIIVMLRNLGFSLKEIKTVLDFKKSKNDYLYHFYIQLKAIETKINELNCVKENLNKTINRILQKEEISEEFLRGIYITSQADDEKTTYEHMVNRWNFDLMAVDYVNRYLKEDVGYLNAINRAASILSEMVANKRVLDIGGGTCNLWIGFQDNMQLTVMDKSLQMLFAAKENVPWANYILDDILQLEKNRYEKYDVVVSTFTLHHIPYELQEKALRAMIDLCKDDGRILIVDRGFPSLSEKKKKEEELELKGDFQFLDIIHSEFYMIADQIISYLRYLGYSTNTLFFEEQIWGFLIDKRFHQD